MHKRLDRCEWLDESAALQSLEAGSFRFGLWPFTCVLLSGTLMKTSALQYCIHGGRTTFRIELAGDVTSEDASRIDREWRVASSRGSNPKVIVDMTYATRVDDWVRALCDRWRQEGAEFVAGTQSGRSLAEWISGEPIPASIPGGPNGAWLPFRSFLATVISLSLLLYLLASPVQAKAAALQSETVAAWEDYVRAVDASLQARVSRRGSFLWTLENANRAARVRNGEIVVDPAPGQNPTKVPGGLIHHWMGAVFLPNVTLQDVLEVTNDYDHYKQFYRPSVVESRTIARSGSDDRFSMLLMNKAFFLRNALDTDYLATSVRLDDRRVYSVSKTIRVQEVDDYGRPGEHLIPEGQGGGYIWKLYSIARFQQRDNGVYLEFEAIALSRDVPAALRFVIDPIVRRVSRNSLLISLQQTEEAVGARLANNATPGGVSAIAGTTGGGSSTLLNRSPAFTGLH